MSGMLDSLNVSALNCFYFGMLAGGLVFALGTLLLSGLGDSGDGGGDGADAGGDGGDGGDGGGDGDGSGGDLKIFSPVTLATFMAVFGAVGLICTVGLELDARLSLLIAGLVAAAVSLAVAALYGRLLVALHGSTDIREADMAGIEAHGDHADPGRWSRHGAFRDQPRATEPASPLSRQHRDRERHNRCDPTSIRRQRAHRPAAPTLNPD